ncbi:O-antigen ligase domain-containing protein [Rhodopseudomonas palustris]|uniref:O-antigen ligase domain-containing protein n=1 Tax=Rhodopseudomonas palustris TaxID=1076 RepID=A0A323U909_RHOPL|nr:O-antigen ligase family protein [Rhodopseudomonas palustris]PZA09312.1 O-antigen ligase domain-containing protein [Rhodopseudomonas palustris]
MVSVAAQSSPPNSLFDRSRAWLLAVKAPERLFVLVMCLMYLMHNIWLSRTILWFLVLPTLLITALPLRNLVPIVKSGVFLASAVFMAVIIVTSLLGDGVPGALLWKNIRYVAAVLVFIMIVAHLASRDGDFLRVLFLWLAPVAAFAAIRDVGTFSHWSVSEMLTVRLQGTKGLSLYYNSNVVGLMYAMPCVGAVAMMATRRLRPWQFVLLFVSALVLLAAVLLSGSRGSLMATLAGIGVAVLLAANWRIAAAVVALVGIAAVATLLTPLASELVQRKDSLRFELWPVYLHMVTLKPWFGYGLAFDPRVTLPNGIEVMNGHNIFMCAAVRGGVIAALALAAVALTALVSGWRAFRRTGKVAGLALLAAGLVASSVDYEIIPSDLGYLYVLLWLPVAICLGSALIPTGPVPATRPVRSPADIATS